MAMRTRLGCASALALAVGAAIAPWGASASAGHAAATPGCTPVNNVEAIIDDSGSMASTDTARLRFNGMQLFIRQNPQDTLGAVQFGTDAAVVFPPTPVAGSESNMIAGLDAAIQADSGSTNYVEAFKQARASNPNAQARIFLTDGGQTLGDIDVTNDHRGSGGPVYVIGLQIGAPGTNADANRLARIAAETNGVYFPNVTATGTPGQANTSIQDVIATISAALSCKSAPVVTQLALAQTGATQTATAPVAPGTTSATITLNWGNSGNQYAVTKVLVRKGGRTIAQGNVPQGTTATATAARKHRKRRKRPSKLTIQSQSGPTFQTLNVSGLKAGTLVYQVQATNVLAPESVSALVSSS